jgi:hypothetical protein
VGVFTPVTLDVLAALLSPAQDELVDRVCSAWPLLAPEDTFVAQTPHTPSRASSSAAASAPAAPRKPAASKHSPVRIPRPQECPPAPARERREPPMWEMREGAFPVGALVTRAPAPTPAAYDLLQDLARGDRLTFSSVMGSVHLASQMGRQLTLPMLRGMVDRARQSSSSASKPVRGRKQLACAASSSNELYESSDDEPSRNRGGGGRSCKSSRESSRKSSLPTRRGGRAELPIRDLLSVDLDASDDSDDDTPSVTASDLERALESETEDEVERLPRRRTSSAGGVRECAREQVRAPSASTRRSAAPARQSAAPARQSAAPARRRSARPAASSSSDSDGSSSDGYSTVSSDSDDESVDLSRVDDLPTCRKRGRCSK